MHASLEPHDGSIGAGGFQMRPIGSALTSYDQARYSLQQCARIDDVKEIRDKAEALALYARQRDDHEMQSWVAEIHLRACVRIGELSRELDAVGHRPSEKHLTSEKLTKTQALADAGISVPTANRYEQLAGGREEQAQHAARAALERYSAETKQTGAVPTMKGLRTAVREAVFATVGKPEPRSTPPKAPQEDPAWIDWTGAVKRVANLPGDFEVIARMGQRCGLTKHLRADAIEAMRRLPLWLAALDALESPHDVTA